MISAVTGFGDMDAQAVSTLPLAAGLAVAEALRRFACPLALKWPNDILASGRKLSGILCERHGDSAIIGIGVNVLQCEFPPEISARATSLKLLGSTADVPAVRDAVLSSLAETVAEWRDAGFASLWPRVAAMDFLRGRRISVRQLDDDAAPVSGICGGIAEDGSLIVGGRPVWAGEAHVEACG